VRVFVLGHRGMLGHVVARHSAQSGHEVLTTDQRYDGTPGAGLVTAVTASGCDRVVNCVGVASGADLMTVNGLLPHHLAAVLGPGQVLVHASSDGVFAGDVGSYAPAAPTDGRDPYGLSKRIGEPSHACAVVLRCSIVGPELGPPRSLLGWFLAGSSPVDGYVNHRWNGITSLEWARLALTLPPGLHQPACAAPLSKADLLEAFAAAFSHARSVRRVSHERSVDRTLLPTITCAPIAEQLDALRSWYAG
jgi:dTDP-4-dehydrorhamnose reductase